MKERKRDLDIHSTKKGNQYYFGMKTRVGADRESKTVQLAREKEPFVV